LRTEAWATRVGVKQSPVVEEYRLLHAECCYDRIASAVTNNMHKTTYAFFHNDYERRTEAARNDLATNLTNMGTGNGINLELK